jgi:hypothetical protein
VRVQCCIETVQKMLMKRTYKRVVLGYMRAAVGALDFFRCHDATKSWGGPFNNQSNRKDIFDAIVRSLRPSVIVETGAFRGATTEYIAVNYDISTFTCEIDAYSYGYVKARLFKHSKVAVKHQDSRLFLKALLGSSDQLSAGTILFYLDAHWGEDLPLAEEIDLIFSHRRDAIVIIDDFKVPWDPGYGYDNYGIGKALTPEYIFAPVERHCLVQLYPTVESSEETGNRRGCVVLANSATMIAKLKDIQMLREWRKL